jgi:hypothetical protein
MRCVLRVAGRVADMLWPELAALLVQWTSTDPEARRSADAALAALEAAEPLECCRRCLKPYVDARRPRRQPCGHHSCQDCIDDFDVCAACGSRHNDSSALDRPLMEACGRLAASLTARRAHAEAAAKAAREAEEAAEAARLDLERNPWKALPSLTPADTLVFVLMGVTGSGKSTTACKLHGFDPTLWYVREWGGSLVWVAVWTARVGGGVGCGVGCGERCAVGLMWGLLCSLLAAGIAITVGARYALWGHGSLASCWVLGTR